ncbi:MAG: hypothetical protein LBQ93_10485 [Treponema sp.]|nr:hypothetical protein [Treponema sp.]
MIVILSKSISNHDKDIIRIYLKDHEFSVREQDFGNEEILGASGRALSMCANLLCCPTLSKWRLLPNLTSLCRAKQRWRTRLSPWGT